MNQEIVYRRSRRDIIMYLLLAIMADLGCMYAIQVNSFVIGFIGIVIFGGFTIYLLFRLVLPNTILTINKEGIKTKYTKGEFISWGNISEIYIDIDSYKDRPVNVLSIKLRKDDETKKNIKFPKPQNKVRGDYNVNLQYSNGNIEDAIKEIRAFYRNNIR